MIAVRGNRREDVPSVEGVRHGVVEQRRVVEDVGCRDAAEPLGGGQQDAVVRTDQQVAASHLEGNRAPRSADAGVDHH